MPAWSRARQVSLFGFMVFHLYSGFIVGFRYPILMLGLWYFVLWPLAVPVQKNFLAKRSELPGAVLLLFTFLVGWYPQLNGSDSRYTAEGRYFSLGNMFDANRSVLFEASFQKNQQSYRIKVIRNQPRLGFYLASTEILLSEGGKPFRHLTGPLSIDNVRIDPAYFQDTHLRLVGDPYLYLYFLRRVNPENVEARLETSLNGGEKVVVFQIRGELPTFRPASRNEWIRDE